MVQASDYSVNPALKGSNSTGQQVPFSPAQLLTAFPCALSERLDDAIKVPIIRVLCLDLGRPLNDVVDVFVQKLQGVSFVIPDPESQSTSCKAQKHQGDEDGPKNFPSLPWNDADSGPTVRA